MPQDQSWIFCQLGAREHFVVPAGLHKKGRLKALMTDSWAPPGSLLASLPGRVGQRLSERYNPAMDGARVEHFSYTALAREIAAKFGSSHGGFDQIMSRNSWFERRLVQRMKQTDLLGGDSKPVVFAYSYAALGILRAAKEAGCTTVLGQIDPAIAEEDIVAQAVASHPELQPRWERAPAEYWRRWREECALADHIVVNSKWSERGLAEAGVDRSKLEVVPLAYQPRRVAGTREYPAEFTARRPLRVLFLGSLVIRKGIAELLDAARQLAGEHVQFDLVGGSQVTVPDALISAGNVHLHGPTSRNRVHGWFDRADLFILPTLSDGFGLTLLEAQSHGLPVISSQRCGEVVTQGIDGLVLEDVSSDAIAEAIRRYLGEPSLLAAHSAATAQSLPRFAPDRIVDRFLSVVANRA